MNESSDRNPVEELAEEFLERYRRGERPALSEYTRVHPELAEEIRELFPALVMLEGVRPQERSDSPMGGAGTTPRLDRLGDYRILREIGRGGMGIVYEAEQESLGRHVALKILPAQSLLEPKHLQRFQREARSAARLHHTNIVPVFGVGECDGLHYYVMQFIHGQGLDQVLAELAQLRERSGKSGPAVPAAPAPAVASEAGSVVAVARSLLTGVFKAAPLTGKADGSNDPSAPSTSRSSAALPASFSSSSGEGRPYWQSVARIGIQAADALAYAHAQGTLHRDIKPANLLLDTQGIVWITDFGLAKAHDSENLTHTGDVVGTLRYMAPERFESKADVRSDVYSLGLTLYELLTLRPAYDESERSKLLHKVMRAAAPSPRKLNPAVPRDLETIVLKAIAADPAHRYQTAQELRDDLERFRDDKPIRARPVGELERIWRWSRRNPMPASLALAFLLSLLIGITGTTWKWLEAVDGRRVADGERAQAEAARQDTQRVLAGVMLDRGIALAEQGEINAGLFWMLEALKTSPQNAERLRWTIGANLAAWTEQTPRLRHLINAPERYVDSCALHPDGKRLLTCDGAGNVMWWDLATGKETLLCKITNSLGCVLSPDGAMFVTSRYGGQDNVSGIVERWDAASGKAIGPPLMHPAWVRGLVFAPNGKQLVTGSDDGTIRVWNAASGELVRDDIKDRSVQIIHLAISPDGKVLASATADASRNWDVPAAAQLWDLQSGKRIGAAMRHKAAVRRITFSPDGRRVATASWDATAQFWDAASGLAIGPPLDHRHALNAICFSPDGQTLATGSSDGIDFWSASSGASLAGKPNVGGADIWDIVWSADGATLVAGGQRAKDGGAIRVFETAHALPRPASTVVDWKHRAREWNEKAILWYRRSIASYNPHGHRVVIGGYDGMARLLDPATGIHVAAPLRHSWKAVSVTAFSPDGKCFATSSRDDTAVGEVRLWDARTGAPIGQPLKHVNNIAALAFSPDGKLLASGGYDRAVHLWDAATGKELAHIGQPDIVLSLAFNADASLLAIGHSHDYSGATGVMLCDVINRKNIGESKKGPGTIVCWSNDGKRLVSTDGGTLCIRHPADDDREALIRDSSPITSILFRPDDKALLTTSSDGSLRLRDPDTGKPIGAPMVASVPVTVAAFSPEPDSKLILAGYADGSVRLWDRVTQKSIGPPLLHRRGIITVAFAPDGGTLLTTSDDGATRAWPMPAPLAADVETLRAYLEARTGLVMMEGQAIAFLDETEWRERREQAARIVVPDSRLAYHRLRAREASEGGANFAARWHLDRLIALQEGAPSWLTWAQRARLASEAGQFAEAQDDYARAEEQALPALLQTWYRVRILESMNVKRWQTAAWYVDRSLGHAPKDWQLYLDRAVAMAHLKKDAEYDADLKRAVELGADAERLLALADDFVRRGDYAKATRAFAIGTSRGPVSIHVRIHHALAALKQGDLPAYRRTCGQALADLGPNPNAGDANATAWLCVFGPDALEEMPAAVRLAENALAKTPPQFKADVLNTLGCILYRAGRHEDAIQRLNEGIKSRNGNGTAIDFLFLAMAHQRLGKTDAAKRYFSQVVPTTSRTRIWDHLEQNVIYIEAETLLKAR